MLSFLRAPSPPRTNQASSSVVKYEDGKAIIEFHGPNQPIEMTHTVPPGDTVMKPPLHYHIRQVEIFRALSGTGNFYLGMDKEPTVVLKPGEGTVEIPRARYHRFENASTTEDFVVGVQLDPEDDVLEQRFFRNFMGYLDDCKKAKTAPSVFQLFVFLQAADISLALPMPHPALETTVGRWASRAVSVAVAAVGKLMGYQSSYSEYYLGTKAE